MRQPLGTVLVSLVLVTNLLQAQEKQSQSSALASSSSDGEPISLRLLRESHDLGQQLSASVRAAEMLPRQIELASQLRPELGRDWANELFLLSSQVKGRVAQTMAISMLLRTDPGRALEFLHSVTIEEPLPKWATTAPEMQLVNRIFQLVIEREGASALPLLEAESERLGAMGHYPYSALGYATVQATNKDWGNDNEHAIRVLQSVYDPVFARYRRSAPTYYDNHEFGQMLQVLAGGLPFDSVQPALRLWVRNLLTTDTSKYQFEFKAYASDGTVVKSRNSIDATLLFFGRLVNRDSELVQELGLTRPDLKSGLDHIKANQVHSASLGYPSSPRTPEQQARMDAASFSYVNADAAISKAEQLPNDEKRAGTILDVARNVAGDYPERAAELIAEAQHGNTAVDDAMSVNLIAAQAFLAVAQSKKDALPELLQSGFASANRAIAEQQKTGESHYFPGLAPLVQIGIQNDADLTIAFIEGLPPSQIKAYMLLTAASDLNRPPPLLHTSRPEQKTEKVENANP